MKEINVDEKIYVDEGGVYLDKGDEWVWKRKINVGKEEEYKWKIWV